MKMLINQILKPLSILSKQGLLSPSVEKQFAKIKVISDTAQIYPKVAFGELTLEAYFQSFLRNSKNTPVRGLQKLKKTHC